VLALSLAIGLFFLLPVGLTSLVKDSLPNAVVFVIVEKLIRITIFLGYLWLVSRLKDRQRVFEYHGAEHKVISCYEAGLPLTPENAKRFSRLHPRCGTSFLLIVAIVVFAPFGTPAWYCCSPRGSSASRLSPDLPSRSSSGSGATAPSAGCAC